MRRTPIAVPRGVIPTVAVTALTAALGLAFTGQSAGAGGSTVTGTVYIDYSSDGVKDSGGLISGSGAKATDPGLAGVSVRAYGSDGSLVAAAVTRSDGTYTISTDTAGPLRIEFSTPSGYSPSFDGLANHTSVQFVSGDASNVDYGMLKPGDYCQDNPDLVTCLQQGPGMAGDTSFDSAPGVFTVPSGLKGDLTVGKDGEVLNDPSNPATVLDTSSAVSPFSSLGTVFGVGTDRSGSAYFGTFVKRHSPYGPGSDGTNGDRNWIYRVNLKTGASQAWIKLGSETLPAHIKPAPGGFPDYAADGRREDNNPNDVYHSVGRAGLGDVDVSPDGSTLWAIEMTQATPRLWQVPIKSSGAAGTPTSYPIPTPTSFNGFRCVGSWHPMAIGIRNSTFLVGGVCSGDESKWVADESDPNSRTQANAFILSFDPATGAFSPALAWSLGYAKSGANGNMTDLRGWHEMNTALWHNWNDSADAGGFGGQPMMGNIEILDDGGLAIAMRDRYSDQSTQGSLDYNSPNSDGATTRPFHVSVAEVLRACVIDGSYEIEHAGACGGITGANKASLLSTASAADRNSSPLFYLSMFIWHPYTSLGGAASMPGTNIVWSTAYDNDRIFQQGVRAMGPCPDRGVNLGSCGPSPASQGAIVGGIGVPWGSGPAAPTFGKGNGLGDLELVCDSAPTQIGNRVWADANNNGIQDPGEQPIAGVTVHLHDSAGNLAGTAITNSNGEYFFSSTVSEAAAGNGDSSGGGLVTGSPFTIRFDNPADYTGSGPLAGYTLTAAMQASPGTGSQSGAVDSTATFVNGYPQIAVAARGAGQNDHSLDAGFITGSFPPPGDPVLVAIGDVVWLDLNGNGIQNRGEPALAGVRVTLLAAGGQPALLPNGQTVPPVTTNALGRYLFDGLNPGSYRVKFTLPLGYSVTRAGIGGSQGIDSNPFPTRARRIAMTMPFKVTASAAGNTVAFNRTGKVAKFANLTIDAGVVRYRIRTGFTG